MNWSIKSSRLITNLIGVFLIWKFLWPKKDKKK